MVETKQLHIELSKLLAGFSPARFYIKLDIKPGGRKTRQEFESWEWISRKWVTIFHKWLSIFHKRVTIFHKRLSISHKRVTIFYKRVIIFHKRVTISHKRVSISHKRLTIFRKSLPIYFNLLDSDPNYYSIQKLKHFKLVNLNHK